MKLFLKNEVYNLVGAAMEVHSQLGNGFLEAVYQEALSFELKERNIPFEKEKKLIINYKGVRLEKYYLADFICYESIVVELKAVNAITPDHESQILNYLKATGLKVGLLLNFGSKSLQYKRFVL